MNTTTTTLLAEPAWLALPLLLALLALFLYARRGRRIDDHPLCRRCRHDLTGLPPTSTQCPECGHPTARPRIGHRRPFGRLAAVAAIAFALVLLAGGARVYIVASGLDLYPWYPVSVLRDRALQPGNTRAPALAELRARLQANRLSPADLSPLVDGILAVQANTALPWDFAFGDLVESARNAPTPLVTDTQWHTYLRHCAEFTLEFRPTYARGQRFPVRARAISRASSQQTILVNYTYRITFRPGQPLETPAHRPDASPHKGGYLVGQGATTMWTSHDLPPGLLDAFPDGPTPVRADIESTFTFAGQPPVKSTTSIDATVTLLPPGADPAPLVNTPGLHDSIAAAITKPTLTFNGPSYRPGRSSVSLNIKVDTVPVGVAYDISLLYAGTEHPLGGIAVAKGKATGWGLSGDLPDPVPPTATVILRPSKKQALGTVDVMEVADVELRFDNVRVTNAPTTMPTTTRP